MVAEQDDTLKAAVRTDDQRKLHDSPPSLRSPLRARIVKESLEANRRKRPTYTKRPRYEGQATFDSKNGMSQLQPSKPACPEAPIWSTNSTVPPGYPRDLDHYLEAPPFSSLSSERPTGEVDPIMKELDNMLEDLKERRTEPESVHVPNLPVVESWIDTEYSTSIGVPDVESIRNTGLCNSTHELPETEQLFQPLTQVQLVEEAIDIYTDLVAGEIRCAESDKQRRLTRSSQSAQRDSSDDQEELTAHADLRWSLLHDHHDFLLASQHPLAPPTLHRLAAKFFMPERMYRHGIEDFLELYRSPGSRHQIIAFAHNAKSLVTYLQDSLPSLAHQFTNAQSMLEQYIYELENHSHPPFDPSRRFSQDVAWSPYAGSSTSYAGSSSTSDAESLVSTWVPTPSWYVLREDFKAGPWDFRYWKTEGEPISGGSTGWTESSSQLNLPDYLHDTLLGWLYFGQGIAADSPPYYCKIFHILILAAKHRSYWSKAFPRLWI